MKLYSQEPAFTSLDHEFLSLLSVHICTDDLASHIMSRSFVFSPFVDWYILLPIFLKGKDPVLYVGNEILDDYGAFAQSEDKKVKLEECNALGRNWLEKRNMTKLGEFEMHPHALNGMVLYMRDGNEEAEAEAKLDRENKSRDEDTNVQTGARGNDEAESTKGSEVAPNSS